MAALAGSNAEKKLDMVVGGGKLWPLAIIRVDLMTFLYPMPKGRELFDVAGIVFTCIGRPNQLKSVFVTISIDIANYCTIIKILYELALVI